MPKITKQEIERYYFETFSKCYALPEGTPEYGDRPDVVLIGYRTIGIEITHLYIVSGKLAHSEQRQKPLREAVVKKAYKQHIAQGHESFGLTVEFDISHPIDPQRTIELAKNLACFAKLPCKHGQAGGYIDPKLFREKAPQIASIQKSAPGFLDTKWRIAQVHSVSLIRQSDIQNIVTGKGQKVAEYKSCDAYWLLIVIEGADASLDQEIRIDSLIVSSNYFEKVFLFHSFGYVNEAKVSTVSLQSQTH